MTAIEVFLFQFHFHCCLCSLVNPRLFTFHFADLFLTQNTLLTLFLQHVHANNTNISVTLVPRHSKSDGVKAGWR